MFAYDYPLLGLFWTILWIYIVIAWFFVLFGVIADIFRNHESHGITKALWFIFVIFVPLVGVLIYVLANGDAMTQRKIAAAQAGDAAMRAYVQDAAGTTSHADEIAQLATLRDQGIIDDADFQAGKAKILS